MGNIGKPSQLYTHQTRSSHKPKVGIGCPNKPKVGIGCPNKPKVGTGCPNQR